MKALFKVKNINILITLHFTYTNIYHLFLNNECLMHQKHSLDLLEYIIFK